MEATTLTKNELSLLKIALRRFTATDEPSKTTQCLMDALLEKLSNIVIPEEER